MSEETTDKASALFSALAKAQGEFKPIEKNREVEITMRSGGKFKFRYADLEEILSKTRPALSANGLALIQRMEPTESGALVHCDLMHAAGGILSSSHLLPKHADDDIKGFGALITYHRRYLVTAMLGVAADDDLDEDDQGKKRDYPNENFNTSFPKWAAAISAGKKSSEQIIATVSSEYTLSAYQLAKIRAIETSGAEHADS